LEAVPDSFRYDRSVLAYGINCGVEAVEHDTLVTVDTVTADRERPLYWSLDDPAPDLRFSSLAADPIPAAHRLLAVLAEWGEQHWGEESLDGRASSEAWSPDMREGAARAAADFAEEQRRIALGVEQLQRDPTLSRAFRAMNQAMLLSANGKYDGWRPFQFGFLLANLASVVDPDSESGIADIVWFATGGGKTETYLGLIVTAALYDRLTGKGGGITAWSRFPLRMLSLQQTQRFADAMAGAERIRREEEIPGDPFSVGFLVGQAATPNRIDEEPEHGKPDPEDDEMPKAYQVLLRCPFCHGETIEMAFDRRFWRLAHRCSNDACPGRRRISPSTSSTRRSIAFSPPSSSAPSTRRPRSPCRRRCAAWSAPLGANARSPGTATPTPLAAGTRTDVWSRAAAARSHPWIWTLPGSVRAFASRTNCTC